MRDVTPAGTGLREPRGTVGAQPFGFPDWPSAAVFANLPRMFDGTWIPHTAEFAGKKIPPHGTRLTIAGDRYVVETPHGTDSGSLAWDTTVVPHHIDIIGTDGPNAGRTIPAVCRLHEERLHICYDVGGGPRPGEFTTTVSSTRLLVIYRQGPK